LFGQEFGSGDIKITLIPKITGVNGGTLEVLEFNQLVPPRDHTFQNIFSAKNQVIGQEKDGFLIFHGYSNRPFAGGCPEDQTLSLSRFCPLPR
jgi:hypothetical protein